MKSKTMKIAALAAAAAALTGCVQDDYDLSDVDTMARFTARELVLPVNLDPVTLNSVIEINEGSRIQIVDGQYALLENGDFHSAEISINAVHLAAPRIAPTQVTLDLQSPQSSRRRAHGRLLAQYPVRTPEADYTYQAGGVSASILRIDRVHAPMDIRCTMRLQGITGVQRVWFEDLVLQLPKGLTTSMAGYDAATGRLTIPQLEAPGLSVDIDVPVSEIDFAKAGGTLVNHEVAITGALSVVSGRVAVYEDDVTQFTAPTQVTLHNDYVMSAITIDEFTGRVQYDIDDLNVSDVQLGDLPDVLKQQGTDISIANPQIYLSVSNPLSANGLQARAGVTITALGNSPQPQSYSLDGGGTFNIGNAPTNYVLLSPTRPEAFYPGFEGAEWTGFASLSNVVSGDGLPHTLKIRLDDPCVYPQDVRNLRLGKPLGRVEGHYTFYAPLALNTGSTVRYEDTVDGWNDEDVDAIVIEKLEVTATVANHLPVDVRFTGYPIDVRHQQIGDVQITTTPAVVPAGGSVELTVAISGEVRHLDGVTFVATATSDAPQTLTPDMTIDVTGIRARVSGYYEKEL